MYRKDNVPASETLRSLAEDARAGAVAVLGQPDLFSVLVDLAESTSVLRPTKYRFGFQKIQNGLILGTRLKTCWVDVSLKPRSLTVGPVGTFGRTQFKELASIEGMPFPPPGLHLDGLRLEAADVLQWLGEHPAFGSATAVGTVQLSVFDHEGHLAWRALQDVEGVGFRTLFLDAGDGRVLYEKVDHRLTPPGASRRGQ